jgi:hypothetical protein
MKPRNVKLEGEGLEDRILPSGAPDMIHVRHVETPTPIEQKVVQHQAGETAKNLDELIHASHGGGHEVGGHGVGHAIHFEHLEPHHIDDAFHAHGVHAVEPEPLFPEEHAEVIAEATPRQKTLKKAAAYVNGEIARELLVMENPLLSQADLAKLDALLERQRHEAVPMQWNSVELESILP